MAKNGAYNGQLAEALSVLDRADKADKASVAGALAMVRKSGVISDEELIQRYGSSDRLQVDDGLGRLVVARESKDGAPQWQSQAHALAKRLTPAIAVYDERWGSWKHAQTPERSHQALNGELRSKASVAQKLAIVALQPSISHATLAATDHLYSKSGPYPSYDNTFGALEVVSAQRSLTTGDAYKEALAPEFDQDKQLFEVYANTDATLVRTRRFLGSYTRSATLVNRGRHARHEAEQSLNLMQQTTFAVEPDWQDLISEEMTAETFRRVESADARQDLGEFIAAQEVMVPLMSSLHVQQRYEILQTRPA